MRGECHVPGTSQPPHVHDLNHGIPVRSEALESGLRYSPYHNLLRMIPVLMAQIKKLRGEALA